MESAADLGQTSPAASARPPREPAMADDERPSRRIALPLSPLFTALLLAAFLLPGVIGRDPWKVDDALGISIAWGTQEGNGLLPRLAGEPYFEDGPLFYWVAGALGSALEFMVPFHDGARIAAMLFVLAALWFVRLAARELYGEPQGQLSMLALLGCLGLFVHAHEASADTAMLAGVAATYYGIAIAWKKPYKAAAFFAGGATVAFLARGIFGCAPPLIAALLLVPFAAAYRARSYVLAVGLGLTLFLVLAAIWPITLATLQPGAWATWWSVQIASVTQPPTTARALYFLKTLTWAAWPAWPLAFWAVWAYRRYLRDPGFAVPVVATLVTLVLLAFTRSQRAIEVLAVLVPLAIPAGAAAVSLRRGASSALASFAVVMFGLIAVSAWVLWFAWHTGFPAQLHANVAKLTPGLVPRKEWLRMATAIVITASWAALMLGAQRTSLRALTFWAAGVALAWGLAASLWLTAVNYTQSYRSIATALRAALPPNPGCIASRGLVEVSRGVLHYHGGILTERREIGRGAQCRWLVVAGRVGDRSAEPGPGWKLVWEGQRPRERERFRLYRRA